MTASDALDFTAPRAVNPAEIEQTLERIWQEQSAGEPGSPAVTRACALNLVVYTTESNARHIDTLIGEITVTHPCRAIIVELQPEATDSATEAWVSAHCHLAVAGQHVCCEQVHLQVRGGAVGRQAGTVLSLLVPDLPFFVWWRSEPPLEAEFFATLARAADRLIVDSASASRPRVFLASLHAFASARLRETVVTDLAWARLTPWRELVAQSFDPPRFCPTLDAIERVTIQYGTGTGPIADGQAWLAAAWLASRLHLRPVAAAEAGNRGATALTTKAASGPVSFLLQPTTPRGPSGLIERIAITGRHGHRVAISRHEDAVCATLLAESPDGPPLTRTVPLGEVGEAGLVSEQLDILACDRVYEAALATAAAFAQMIETPPSSADAFSRPPAS